MRRFLAIAAPVVLWSSSSVAQQPTDEAAAAAQFDRGLALMNEGKLEVGCPALLESVRLDPRPGAIFTLAECEARWGHVASADAHYDDYLARFARMTAEQQGQQRGRETIAAQKRAELRAKIPQLAIRLPAGAPPNVVVKRDGVVLGAPSLGIFLPVDPGPHVIDVETPDGAKVQRTVKLELSSRQEVTLELPGPVRKPSDVGGATRSPTPWLAYGALGVGAVGVGVGVVGGLVAMGKTSTIDAHCKDVVCDHEGKTAADSARSAALVSTIGFAVGGVGIAAGIILLVTRPRAGASGARSALPLVGVDAHGATLGASGAF
jgi:hypothetical protein